MLIPTENIIENDGEKRVSSFTVLVIVAAVAGVAMATQAQLMGHLDKSVGTIESVFLTYSIGAVVIALIMLAMRGGNLGEWHSAPWYAHFAGLLGLIIVGCIGYATPRLGLAVTLTIAVAAQFAIAAIVHQFGLLGADQQPLDLSRLGGMAAILIGVWLMMRQ
jgi:transporter family-2 protein